MLRCGADPRAISRHSNAPFARQCQSFLQESQQYECWERSCYRLPFTVDAVVNLRGEMSLSFQTG